MKRKTQHKKENTSRILAAVVVEVPAAVEGAGLKKVLMLYG